MVIPLEQGNTDILHEAVIGHRQQDDSTGLKDPRHFPEGEGRIEEMLKYFAAPDDVKLIGGKRERYAQIVSLKLDSRVDFLVERDLTPTPAETLSNSYRYLAGLSFS